MPAIVVPDDFPSIFVGTEAHERLKRHHHGVMAQIGLLAKALAKPS